MTAGARPGPGLVRTAAGAVVDFLFEPAATSARAEVSPAVEFPVVTVIGLAPRCGATTVARGLAAELALRSPARHCPVEAGTPAVAVAMAAGEGPLVLDVGRSGAAVDCADTVLLVASAATEPALARVVSASLRSAGADVVTVVARRSAEPARWEGRCDVVLPEARMAARAVLAGHRPRGALGRTFRELADRVDAASRSAT